MTPEQRADLLRKRLGLTGQPPQTLRDLAEEYGITAERVRMIEHMHKTSAKCVCGLCRRDRLVAFFAEVMTDDEAREAADIASGKEIEELQA